MSNQQQNGRGQGGGTLQALAARAAAFAHTRAGVVTLAACAVVLCVLLGFGGYTLVSGAAAGAEPASSAAESQAASEPEADSAYDASANAIDVEQYSGTILPETEDAGTDYIDNTLFIGDSNTVRYMSYGFITLKNGIGVIGMGAGSIKTLECAKFQGLGMITVPQAVKVMQPQRVVFGFGTNDLTGDCSAYIQNYEKGIKAAYDAYPYFDVIVSAIPPVDKYRSYPSVTMQNIDKFNAALVEMCERNGWKFLNISEVLKNESTGFAKTEYTISDGLHLSKEGCTALFQYFRTHAWITEDRRPKPLSQVPKRLETPPDLIVKDPLKIEGEVPDLSSSKTAKVEITFVAGEGGTIEGALEQSVEVGAQCSTVVAKPKEGYVFAGWSCTVGRIEDVSNPSLTFTVPGGDNYGGIFVTASFKKEGCSVSFSVSATDGSSGGVFVEGGSTSSSITVSVSSGQTASVRFRPATGYVVVTEGAAYTAKSNGDGTYTISVANVTEDKQVAVKVQPLIAATPTPSPSPTPSPAPSAPPATETPTEPPATETPVESPEPETPDLPIDFPGFGGLS